jgi:predicted transcriptional regulator
LRVNELYQNGDCSQRDLAGMFEIAQSALSERYLW